MSFQGPAYEVFFRMPEGQVLGFFLNLPFGLLGVSVGGGLGEGGQVCPVHSGLQGVNLCLEVKNSLEDGLQLVLVKCLPGFGSCRCVVNDGSGVPFFLGHVGQELIGPQFYPLKGGGDFL